MKNFTIILVAILFLTTSSTVKAQGKVSGAVTDQNNKALPGTTVSLLQAKDSSLVKAAITDAGGKFEIAVTKAGSYLLSYSLVGSPGTELEFAL